MKKILIIFSLLILLISLVNADEDFTEAKRVIDSGVNCNELGDEQFELIGDYYMEQMHPGESHELMDQMMGGEGSDSLKLMHINMAKRLYCNEDVYVGYASIMGSGMGMMNMMYGRDYYSGINNLLLTLLLIGLIVLVILGIIKLLKDKKR
ncbi:MAG: hypothetical protein AABX55_02855 [Nanoarchaeota archaeon]